MKPKLIIQLLIMMMSYTSISQTIKNDSILKDSITIAKTTLRNMAQDQKRCNLFLAASRKAYTNKSKEASNYAEANLKLYKKLELEELKDQEFDKKINDSFKILLKKNQNTTLEKVFAFSFGTLIGAIVHNNYKQWLNIK